MSNDSENRCENCILLKRACKFTPKARPVSKHSGKPRSQSASVIEMVGSATTSPASSHAWGHQGEIPHPIGTQERLQMAKPSESEEIPKLFDSRTGLSSNADVTTWFSGGLFCGHSPLSTADAASSAPFPVQPTNLSQPCLLIEQQMPLTATPCNPTIYPIMSFEPQNQTIFWTPSQLLQEFQSAYGTTTLGLHSNHK